MAGHVINLHQGRV